MHLHKNESKTKIVVAITAVTMIVEIISGYITNSMALLADGWHMGSHVLALGLSWIAYYFARKNENNKNFRNGTGKILSLSGYSSAIFLLVVAILMAVESIERFYNPLEIHFFEAIIVAIVGLIVNIASVFILHTKHHEHDHNIKSAYLHVLADALTSLTAIIALIAGMIWNLHFLDALGGIISSIVITKWSIGLLLDTGKDLLDYKRV